jgi:hypothetical protein
MRVCIQCRNPGTHLIESLSSFSDMNYYRCDVCGCVFHVPKDRPLAKPVPVTPCR